MVLQIMFFDHIIFCFIDFFFFPLKTNAQHSQVLHLVSRGKKPFKHRIISVLIKD